MRDLSTILDGVDVGEKYKRTIVGAKDGKIDVYGVIKTYEIWNPEMQHALKKILCPGSRGSKSEIEDLKEALYSIVCRIEDLQDNLVTKDVGYVEGEFPKTTIHHPDDPRSQPVIPPGKVCWSCRKVLPTTESMMTDSNGNIECWDCYIKNKVEHDGVYCKVCKKHFPDKNPKMNKKFICDRCIKTKSQPG